MGGLATLASLAKGRDAVPARFGDFRDDSASPPLCSVEDIKGDEQVICSPTAFDFGFNQPVMQVDANVLGEYLLSSHVPNLPTEEGGAIVVASSTFCFSVVPAWDRLQGASIFFDARPQFFKQNDRAPLPVIIGFSDSIVEASHEQIVALNGSALDQHSGEGPEGKDGRVVHAGTMP